jgi:hypothetical protein
MIDAFERSQLALNANFTLRHAYTSIDYEPFARAKDFSVYFFQIILFAINLLTNFIFDLVVLQQKGNGLRCTPPKRRNR